MELDKEIRVLFNSQYFNHSFVYQYTDLSYSPPSAINGAYLGLWQNESELPYSEPVVLLRTIGQLTDDESIELIKLEYGIFKWYECRFEVTKNLKGNTLVHIFRNETHYHSFEISIGFLKAAGCQYLLRIGILLPFTYLNTENKPVTLQPGEIIKQGWAKINTP